MMSGWSTYYREGFLVQLIFYSMIWVMDEYTGLLLCMIMAVVIGGLLAFAFIVELVQKSKVPKAYYYWMALSTLAPIIVGIGFSLLWGVEAPWMKE